MNKDINLNTVLITIVLALTAWTLKTAVDLRAEVSSLNARVQNLERITYR